MAVVASLQPGTLLQGRYRVESVLGVGGMSVVYLVEGIHLRRRLALKEMHEQFLDRAQEQMALEQFQNEAATLASLDHAGIPKVLDFFVESGRAYLVMEYLQGKTLEEVVRETTQVLSEQQVLGWMKDVLDTLEYLHGQPQPVVVRDIKPSNMILTAAGRTKLVDFGIAKFHDASEKTSTAIQGTGSQGFAPPEQYAADASTDPRTDIYSLGATMYYLLTKKVVPESVDRLMARAPIQPPSYYNPMVNPRTDQAILAMLELHPQDRPQSVAEVREALASPSAASSSSPVRPTSDLAATSRKLRHVELPKDWDRKAEVPAPSGGRSSMVEDVKKAVLEQQAQQARQVAARQRTGLVATLVVLLVGGASLLAWSIWSRPASTSVASSTASPSASPSRAPGSPTPVASTSASPSPRKDPDKTTVVLKGQAPRTGLGRVLALSALPGDLRVTLKTRTQLLVLSSQKLKPPLGLGIGATVEARYVATSETRTRKKKDVTVAGSLQSLRVIPLAVALPAGYPRMPPGGIPPGYRIPAGMQIPAGMRIPPGMKIPPGVRLPSGGGVPPPGGPAPSLKRKRTEF